MTDDHIVTTHDPNSGVTVLRQALKAWHKTAAHIAQDAGISAEALYRFTYQGGSLSLAAVNKLVEHVWQGHMVYDGAVDAVVSAYDQTPAPAPVMPLPLDLSTLPKTPIIRESPIHPNYASPSPPKVKRQGFNTRW